ncbi:hypothetical protein EMIHUDRAFT_71030, partial [Emiliania huxleyi CCMP1516]|uniref:Kinesin-like protein n=2 Tax=Emiliania huxleyi TaxID=2903 RepID=A0A0D3KJ10_EMIH1
MNANATLYFVGWRTLAWDGAEFHESDQSTVLVRTGDGGFRRNREQLPGSHLHGPDADQESIYSEVAVPVLESVLQGYNGTILAYGQTGSGKTYTLLNGGAVVASAGLVPRLAAELFVAIQCDVRHVYSVSASFCQIYNEQARHAKVDDLLRLKNNNLRIKPKGVGTEVEGLTRTRCNSAEELLQLLETGRRNIIYAETKMNKSSSRSHAVLQMYVTRRARILEGLGSNSGLSASLRLGGDVQATQLTGKLSLVDLAGSERVKRSGADEEKTGKRMKEAININTSLLGLSNVMKALGQAASHVPYRDSKLTHLLSDSLGGNCRTSLIVCASQASLDASETTGALDFGARAMQVKVSA